MTTCLLSCVPFAENQEKTEDPYEENSHLNSVPHWISNNSLGECRFFCPELGFEEAHSISCGTFLGHGLVPCGWSTLSLNRLQCPLQTRAFYLAGTGNISQGRLDQYDNLFPLVLLSVVHISSRIFCIAKGPFFSTSAGLPWVWAVPSQRTPTFGGCIGANRLSHICM